MKIRPFTINLTIARVVTFCAGIAILTSTILLIIDESQKVLALFAFLQGFGALSLFWASFSRTIATRIKQGKDISVFRSRARNILLGVALLPLVGVACLIIALI